ncbi:retention module-containing protein [Campylobacter sp. MOP51]|uniref:retention module-containing protein n=1 Tax=Campylobacter canis TaxID=3378588 RepID=UPI003C4CB786
MATIGGIVKQISGTVVAVDTNGNERILRVGDEVFLGEAIKTQGEDSSVVLTLNNGKDVTILGNDILALNSSFLGSGSEDNVVADINSLQQAILQGQNLQSLEETAAGGSGTINSEGTFSQTSFTRSGSISNVVADYGNLDSSETSSRDFTRAIGSGFDPSSFADTTPTPAPTVTFIEDANDDGFLNENENNSDNNRDKTSVKITVPPEAEVGDTLNIIITKPDGSTENKTVPITQEIINNGHIINDIPVEDNRPSKVEATITDQSGNVSSPGSDQVTADLTPPAAPTVKFDEDTNDNGVLNKNENDADGKQNETKVTITVPPATEVGDTLNITITNPDGTKENKTVIVTPDIKNNGYVMENIPVEDGKPSKVEATITDKAGNESPKGSDEVTTHVTPTPAPTVTFIEDANNNGFLSKSENDTDGKQNETSVKVTIPNETQVGDVLKITIINPDNTTRDIVVPIPNDTALTNLKNNGYIIDNIPVADGKPSKVEATITDKAGNESPKGSDEVIVDITPPVAPTVNFDEDTNNDGLLNKSENDSDSNPNQTKVTITVPPATEVGDTLNITITNPDGTKENKTVIVTPDIKNNGYVMENIPVEDGKPSKVEATITDKAGNESPKGSDEVTTDLTPPSKPKIEFSEDRDNDKTLNKSENDQDQKPNQTSVKVTVPPETQVGDTINISIVDSRGGLQEFSYQIPDQATLDSIKLNGYTVGSVNIVDGETYKAETSITDKAGNVGEKSYPDEVTVDITPTPAPTVTFTEDTNNDGLLSKSENDSDNNPNETKVIINIPNETKVGDTLNITITNPNGTKEVINILISDEATLTDLKTNGHSIDNIPVQDGKPSKVEATITDKAGNESPKGSDEVTTDTTVKNPKIIFTEDGDNVGNSNPSLNNDGILNRFENRADGNESSTKVRVIIPDDAKVGDVINAKVINSDGATTAEKQVTIDQTIFNNKFYEFDTPIENNKTYTAEATITDKAGNTSEKVSDKIDVSLTPPPPPIVTFTEDSGVAGGTGNNNGIITYDENAKDSDQTKTTVNVKVPQDSGDMKVVVGDTLNIKVYKDGNVIDTKTIKITDQTILDNLRDNGDNIEIGNLINTSTYKVEATITNAVGSISDYGSDEARIDIAPVVTLIEDTNNDGYLSGEENKKGDNNLRKTTAEITIPEGAVVGDKMKVTYTNVSDPNGPKLTKEVTLTQTDIDNKKVATDIPVLPGVKTEVSAILKNSSGADKSEISNTDSVELGLRTIDVKFDEIQNLELLTRQEAISDGKIDKTTATVTIPDNVKTGDKLILTIKEPDQSERDIEYTMTVDPDTGLVTISGGGTDKALVPTDDPYVFKLPDIAMKPRDINDPENKANDTTIKARVDYADATPDVSTGLKSIGVEALKTPEVIFDEAKGGKVTSRNDAVSDGDLFNTPVTIKIPKNAVTGDKLKVTITEPQENGADKVTVKEYTIDKNKTDGKVTITDDSTGSPIDMTTNNSFKLIGIDTLPGKKTIVSAEIKDAFGASSATSENTLADLNEMAVMFDEDTSKNTILSRDEASKDKNLYETTVSIKIPSNVVSGDKLMVTVKEGTDSVMHTHQYSIEKDLNGVVIIKDMQGKAVKVYDNNTIKIDGVLMSPDKKTTVEAKTQDSKGISKAEANNSSILTKLNDDMSIKFDEDTSENGILSPSENSKDNETNKTTVSIKLPSNTVDGDKLNLTVTDKDGITQKQVSYIIHKDDSGNMVLRNGNEEIKVTDNVSKIAIPVVEENRVDVKAEVTDSKGTDKVSASNSLEITGTGPGVRKIGVIFNEDNDSKDGKLTRDEAMKDGSLDATTARVTIPSDVSPNDQLKVTITHGDGSTETRTYTILSNDNGSIKVRDVNGVEATTDGDGNIRIEGIKMADDKTSTLKAEIVGKSQVADGKLKLMPMEKELTVSFDEDNASRNGKLSRDESMVDGKLHETTASVTIPKNVVAGDKIVVAINEPQAGGGSVSRTETFAIEKDANGVVRAVNSGGQKFDVVENTIKIQGLKVLEGQKTSVTATIRDVAGKDVISQSKEVELETIKKELEVVFDEDASNDGIMSRDEAMQDVDFRSTTVSIKLPSNVIEGDKLKVTINEPGKAPSIKEFTIHKDDKGVITVTDNATNAQLKVVDNAIKLENIAMAEKQKTSVKAEISNSLGEDKTESEDSAQLLKMQDVKFMEYTEGSVVNGVITINPDQNAKDGDASSTRIFMRLPDDAVVGDTMVISHTDPDNPSKTITQEIQIAQQDIDFGKVGATILTKPGTDITVTSKVVDQKGISSVPVSFGMKITDDGKDNVVEYDGNKQAIYGGLGKDTLVFNSDIDLSKVANLDKKLDSFEAIKLGNDGASGAVKLTITAKDVFDVTDDSNTILKILGDSNDKVAGKGEWRESADQSKAEAGFKVYESVNQVDGKTIQIQIDSDIKTDF